MFSIRPFSSEFKLFGSEVGVIDKTHGFIHTSLYCTFSLPLSGNVKKGVTVVVFKISDLDSVLFSPF